MRKSDKVSGLQRLIGKAAVSCRCFANQFFELLEKVTGETVIHDNHFSPHFTGMIRELSQQKMFSGLMAYKLKQQVDMSMKTFDKNSARKLDQYTQKLLVNTFREWSYNE